MIFTYKNRKLLQLTLTLNLSTSQVLDLAKKANLELHPEPSSSSFVRLPAEEEIRLYFVVKERAQELKAINTWLREQQEETYLNQGSDTEWMFFLKIAIEGRLNPDAEKNLEELYPNNSTDSVLVKMQRINNRGIKC